MSVELSGLCLPLAHFTLEVDAVLSGRVTGIFGASGAGKTSLLELIAGLRRPAAGAVRIDGRPLTDSSTRLFVRPERRAVGYVPQEGALFPHLSVRKNLLYGFSENGARPVGLTFEHVTEVLEIAALAERRIQTLSGGEKQRVALGRALLASPRLLLLDEPLAGLDAPLRDRLLPYLARVRDEFAIPMIYVTHSPDEVMALCDDVVILSQGKIEERGAPVELFVPAAAPRFVRR
ncbi:MAG TPA: ATP-binding cassette domain-containing protein [Lacunisphaera sp.]